MIAPAVPRDETARLADLRALKILDTPSEARFDRLVRLASLTLRVPMAFISTIDSDRQWLKAKCGLDISESPRAYSFCGHAILQNKPMIVQNATLDERFATNPLVTGEPFIRFYAGYPLTGPKGHNVATFCVADTSPRELRDDEMRTLVELASIAQHELDMFETIDIQQRVIDLQEQLEASRSRLASEMKEAAAYIRTLIPDRMTDGDVTTDWEYQSASSLGGDLFGYHWLGDDKPTHLAIYLIDVMGHGVAPSLLAATVHNMVRRQSLPNTDFMKPEQVLTALNRLLPMQSNGGRFFTIWYGVYDTSKRQLRYASAGHHPAALFNGRQTPKRLGQNSLMIGIEADSEYESQSAQLDPGSRIYLFSDGAFEIRKAGAGPCLGYEGFVDLLQRRVSGRTDRVRHCLSDVQTFCGETTFHDDFTLLELTFS